jgi:O-antigen/teichoic acid export membrane protein
MLSLLAGAAFLTKMCYLSLAFNTLFAIAFLTIFYLYVRARLNVRVPVVLLGLVFLALQVDALGNFFRMYGQRFGPMQYDEFAHMMVQVLISPAIVWFVGRMLHQRGLRLPLWLTAFFAATTVFSLSAAYEIIELWDEIYFGGKRIWGPYDTATDLMWDLCGIIVGTVFSCIMLRTFQPVYRPTALEQS